MSASSPLVGILALQGGWADHVKALQRLGGIQIRLVKTEADLSDLDGLILPGGESTAVGRILVRDGLLKPLRELLDGGLPCWGTCMGAILLASHIEGREGNHLGVMDITVERNAYGSQLDSFIADETIETIGGGSFPLVFIRAPVISSVGPSTTILARHEGRIVAVRQGNLFATTFHPELSEDLRFHALFVQSLNIIHNR